MSVPYESRREHLVCDVVVIGAGIAGVTAALTAAQAGVRVVLACAGPIFSGASFYGSTWGLGLVGPKNEDDLDDLVASVLERGRGMADPVLVRKLISGVGEACSWLERLGLVFRIPDNPEEHTFVPCFDSKTRRWRGLERGALRTVFERELTRLEVTLLPYHSLVDLVQADNTLCGAVLVSASREIEVEAPSVVLATGGLSGLFSHSLMGPYVTGRAAGLALRHGCILTNLEFIQLMPTIVRPVSGIVFNEKSFRYAEVEGLSYEAAELLEQRSGHGPFSASLPTRAIDLAIAEAGTPGARIRFPNMPDNPPEFVRTYLSWLSGTTGLTAHDELQIHHYAHAANGGIRIDENAATGKPGLFACGEACGGMHGADRIGGLSSANALVFGRIAGNSAAARAYTDHPRRPRKAFSEIPPCTISPKAAEIRRQMRNSLFEHCLVIRHETGLTNTLNQLDLLMEQAEHDCALTDELLAASALVTSARERRESRGAHFRADYPAEDPTQARPFQVCLEVEAHGDALRSHILLNLAD